MSAQDERQALAETLAAYPTLAVSKTVYRCVNKNADPLAPSTNGGRWAPPPQNDVSILYTSLKSDGAVAEKAAFLLDLTPPPRGVTLRLAEIRVALRKVVTLTDVDLAKLGVDLERFGTRDYGQTQQIGAALKFLGCDGLVAPSARWDCANLMVYTDNLTDYDSLRLVEKHEFALGDWLAANEAKLRGR